MIFLDILAERCEAIHFTTIKIFFRKNGTYYWDKKSVPKVFCVPFSIRNRIQTVIQD